MKGINICHSIIETAKNLIQSEEFRIAYRIGNSFTRNKKLGMDKLIYFLLHQSKVSLPINIENFLDDFPNAEIESISKQAISKARQGINLEAFIELMRISHMKYHELCQKPKLWNGYRIFGIDGTRLQVPQTAQNLEVFGKSKNQSEVQLAMASASLMYDVLNDIIIDAQINICDYSERKYANQHLDAFQYIDVKQKHILVFDRGYPSFEMYRRLIDEKHLFVMRIKNNSRLVAELETDDAIVDYGPRYPKGSRTYRLRIIKIPLETEDEFLITNILDTSFTQELFKELYFLRWNIESKYEELKEWLKLEEFSGNSPHSIRQDFYLCMFLSNLISILKTDIDKEIAKKTYDPDKNFTYQSTRTFLISRIKRNLVKMLWGIVDICDTLNHIVERSKKVRSQVQPNRKYERKNRRSNRKHHHNRKSCL